MPTTIVAGAQWGDEGKGRMVDLLAGEADMVIRCQGGPNAGHTVINDYGKFVLHSVPSGVFSDRARCIIGAGTVVSPSGLVGEMQNLADAGIDIGRVLISERAHLVLSYHRLLEHAEEARRSPESRIEPTGQGIGPTYADKAARCGLRAGDLLNLAEFKKRLAEQLPRTNRILAASDQPPTTEQDVLAEVEPAAEFLRGLIGDTVGPVSEALDSGKRIILEGQLGVMRDLDWGAYPFVTSSSPTPAGMVAGAGVPLQSVDRVIGVVKAYTSAVGTGPFPTESSGDRADYLRERGGEYGATTGRPRRCGWFDAVAVAWAARVAGFTELALTKIDVLDGLPTVPMCVGYRHDGRTLDGFPTTRVMGEVEPVWREMPGWSEATCEARKLDDLPPEARRYADEVERRAGVRIAFVSVGPEREAIVSRAA